jgi:AmmeMemoRadiSam system protein A
MTKMNPYVDLAQKTIKDYLIDGRIFDVELAPETLRKQSAGCFVSLHLKKTDELRGCIGTILPTCKNLAAEIVNNAISACRDPRFMPVTKDELSDLDISVDILSEPESINSEKSLNPKKYGVIAKTKDGRTGLLLPDLEGIDDAAYQMAIARQKAGIKPNEKIYLYRFTVDRYTM